MTGEFDMYLKTLEFTFERLADYIDTFGTVTLKSKIDSDWESYSGFFESDPAKISDIHHVPSQDGILVPFHRWEVTATENSPNQLYLKYSFYAKLIRNFGRDLR